MLLLQHLQADAFSTLVLGYLEERQSVSLLMSHPSLGKWLDRRREAAKAAFEHARKECGGGDVIKICERRELARGEETCVIRLCLLPTSLIEIHTTWTFTNNGGVESRPSSIREEYAAWSASYVKNTKGKEMCVRADRRGVVTILGGCAPLI